MIVLNSKRCLAAGNTETNIYKYNLQRVSKVCWSVNTGLEQLLDQWSSSVSVIEVKYTSKAAFTVYVLSGNKLPIKKFEHGYPLIIIECNRPEVKSHSVSLQETLKTALL